MSKRRKQKKMENYTEKTSHKKEFRNSFEHSASIIFIERVFPNKFSFSIYEIDLDTAKHVDH